MTRHRIVGATLIVGALVMAATAAPADAAAVDFESYTNGSVHNQDGWSSLGSAGQGCGKYDHGVVDNTFGYSTFGSKALRMSNAVTTGCFGDQTFTKPLANEAGETNANNGGMSGGTRQRIFTAQWDFASTVPAAEQSGLSVVASPDRGDGARMSWIQMADTPTGLEVNFYGYDASLGGTCSDLTNFVFVNVASGLDRTVPHSISVSMLFADGPGNDVVVVSVDGTIVHRGTSWEDYFRLCQPEAGPDGTPASRSVDSILFRTAGAAAPASMGKGFVIDNVQLRTSIPDLPL